MSNRLGTIPPKSEKQNQHYVPRWWLKAFADASGNIWALQGDSVGVVAAGDIMSEDWIYTLFDAWWRPSDALEDELSKIEGLARRLFKNIAINGPSGTDDWSDLVWFIALTACRHPDAMRRGVEISREAGFFLREVRNYPDAQSFASDFAGLFGSPPPPEMYPTLCELPQEIIDGSISHLFDLQPYDPSLPQTDALLATNMVANAIKSMDCRLLTAPLGTYFVLGDHPIPTKDLSHGFTVPLSKSLALEALPPAGRIARRSSAMASPNEVEACNREQASMAHRHSNRT